jgi:hypothetical protein
LEAPEKKSGMPLPGITCLIPVFKDK